MEGEEAAEGRKGKRGNVETLWGVSRLLIRRVSGQGLEVERSTCRVFAVYISVLVYVSLAVLYTSYRIVSYCIVSYRIVRTLTPRCSSCHSLRPPFFFSVLGFLLFWSSPWLLLV
ncbi:uncharacterized protein LY79DRAFT_550328 [Colletotrichum navitas]|uniref:Uncharacterized protein n=1 Tax=Colletotrichum navitas TaxID=681940 RepID=A0AAD8V711_9PEZI|nr:uncharacterized protein LY79DRAFT_550328 [Colletotrichum navitas]KAK1593930.1 hypothetical protein LY79DRAFT_550328 [Colletotrichum navitas]